MRRLWLLLLAPLAALIVPGSASALTAPVGLGTAAAYSVLGGQTVTNTGPSTLAQGLGVFPGSAFTGFPPGIAAVTHAADAPAGQAQSDLTAAYLNAAGRASTGSVAGDIVGRTFTDGVYTASSSLFISGTVTLDGQGDPNSVFIFQTGSTLITASASRVVLVNGALPCNVFWQVGSSATLGTGSTFVGTIMALTSITVTTDVTVQGRALARNGSTTLDSDVFIAPGCTSAPPPVTTTAGTSAPPPATTAATTTPIETTTATSIVVGGGSTSIVVLPPSLTTIEIPNDCHCSTTVEVSVTGSAAQAAVTTASTSGDASCVPPEAAPKAKHRNEFALGAGTAALGGVATGCGIGLLRFLRRR